MREIKFKFYDKIKKEMIYPIWWVFYPYIDWNKP